MCELQHGHLFGIYYSKDKCVRYLLLILTLTNLSQHYCFTPAVLKSLTSFCNKYQHHVKITINNFSNIVLRTF